MTRSEVLSQLVDAVLRVDVPHATRVSVDGIDGSGKTRLADDLVAFIGTAGRACHRASIDDFRWPGHRERSLRRGFTPETYYGESYDYPLLRDQLLAPLSAPGVHRCLLAKWNALRDEPDERWEEVDDDAIVVVDGIFLQHPSLQPYWDYRIWVDVDTERALTRARDRDSEWFADEEIVDRYMNRNFPAHAIYVEHTSAPTLADVVVDNRDPAAPVIVRG